MSELSYLEKLLDGAEVEWSAEWLRYVRGIYSKSNESLMVNYQMLRKYHLSVII
jgi:hypothetical protein